MVGRPVQYPRSLINSGDRYNAIAREAIAIVAVPKTKSADFENYILSFEKTAKSELAATEPGLSINAVSADRPAKVMNATTQAKMLSAVYGSVHGVQRMSDSVPGLVETSCNLGIFTADKGQWKTGILVRVR
jgi:dipeptidase D